MAPFATGPDAGEQIKATRLDGNFNALRQRIQATLNHWFDHRSPVKDGCLQATLRAIHFAHEGDGENLLLMQLAERVEDRLHQNFDMQWGVLAARVMLSLKEKHRFVELLATLGDAPSHPVVAVMNRVADRWRASRHPDFSAQKIFCIGLSRTGTKSLDSALTKLGYDAAHWINPITKDLLKPDDYFLFDAFSDITVAADYCWLRERFTNAKFIFTQREPASWNKSISRHYKCQAGVDNPRELTALPSRLRFSGRAHKAEESVYGGWDSWQDALVAHEDDVQGLFPSEDHQFLLMNIVSGDGWAQLCPFLGKPDPFTAFPHE